LQSITNVEITLNVIAELFGEPAPSLLTVSFHCHT
jgi:hypothetical protein